MSRALLSLCLLLLPGTAMADLPRYDVEAHCNQIAGFGGSYSNEMYNFCVQSEQTAYNALKPVWSKLDGTIRTHCDKIASFGTPGSYEMLKFCVDEETVAGANRPTFEY